jgi:RNA-binding protein YhbY
VKKEEQARLAAQELIKIYRAEGAAAERKRLREAVEKLGSEDMRHASVLWVEGFNIALRRVFKLLKDGDGE